MLLWIWRGLPVRWAFLDSFSHRPTPTTTRRPSRPPGEGGSYGKLRENSIVVGIGFTRLSQHNIGIFICSSSHLLVGFAENAVSLAFVVDLFHAEDRVYAGLIQICKGWQQSDIWIGFLTLPFAHSLC